MKYNCEFNDFLMTAQEGMLGIFRGQVCSVSYSEEAATCGQNTEKLISLIFWP